MSNVEAETPDQEKVRGEVQLQDVQFKLAQGMDEIKNFEGKLTKVNDYVNNEILKLKELLEDKNMKKRVLKIVEQQFDEVNQRVDEEDGTIVEVKEKIQEITVILQEIKDTTLVALQAQVNTNTQSITQIREQLGSLGTGAAAPAPEASGASSSEIAALKEEIEKLKSQIQNQGAPAPAAAQVQPQERAAPAEGGAAVSPELSDEVAKLKEDMELVKKRVARVATKEDVGEVRKKHDTLRDDLDKVRGEMNTFCEREAVDHVEQKVAEVTDLVNHLKGLADVRDRANKLEDDNTALRAGQDGINKKLEDLKHEVEILKGDVNRRATNDGLELLKSQVEEKAAKISLDEVNNKVEEVQRRATKLEENVSGIKINMKPTNGELSSALNDVTDEIKQLKDKLGKAATMDDIAQLRERLAAVSAHRKHRKSSSSGAPPEIPKGSGGAGDVSPRSMQAASDTEELAQKILDLKKAIDGKLDREAIKADFVMKGDFKDFKEYVEQFRSETATRSELARARDQVSMLKYEVQGMKAKLETLTSKDDHLALKERVDALEIEVAALKKLADQVTNIQTTYVTKDDFNPIRHLADRNKENTDANNQALAELGEKMGKFGDAVQGANALRGRVDRLAHMLKELRNDVNALKEMPESVEERDVDILEEDTKEEPPSPAVMNMFAVIQGHVDNDKEQIEALRQKLDEIAAALDNLNKEVGGVPAKQGALEQDVNALRDQLANQALAQAQAQEGKDGQPASPEVLNLIAIIRGDVDKDKGQIDELRQQLEKLAGDLSNLSQEVGGVPAKQGALEQDVNALRDQLNNQALAQAQAQAQDGKDAQPASPEVLNLIAVIRGDVDKDKGQIDELRQQLEKLAGDLSNLSQEVGGVPAKQGALEQDVNALRDQLNNQALAQAQAQDGKDGQPASPEVLNLIAIIRGDVDKDKGQIDELRQQLEKLAGDLNNVNKEVEGLPGMRDKQGALEQDVNALRDQLNNQAMAAVQTRDANDGQPASPEVLNLIAIIRGDVDKDKGQIDELRQKLDKLASDLDTVNREVGVLPGMRDKQGALEQDVNALRDQLNNQAMAAVQTRDANDGQPASPEVLNLIAIIRGDVDKDKGQIEALRQKLEQVDGKIDNVAKEVSGLPTIREKQGAMEREILALRDLLNKAQANDGKDAAGELRKQLQGALAQIRQELNNLKSEIDKLKANMGNSELKTEITNWVESRLNELHTQLHKETTDNAMSIRRIASQMRESQQVQTRDVSMDMEYLARDVDRLKRIVDRLAQEDEQPVGGSDGQAAASPEVIKAIRQLKAGQSRLNAETAQFKMELYACMKMSESIIYSVQGVLPAASASGVGSMTMMEQFETINNHSTRISSLQLDINDIKDTIADILNDREGRAVFVDPGVPSEGTEMTFENPLTGPVPEGGIDELRSYLERLRLYLVQLKKDVNKLKSNNLRSRSVERYHGKKTKKGGSSYASID